MSSLNLNSLKNKVKIRKTMRKSISLIAESIRTSQHPFPRVIDRPHKEQKHRYERRKVKEYIRLADWAEAV
jgi:hypothetical protein